MKIDKTTLQKKIEKFSNKSLKPLCRKIVGWEEIEEQINTVHFFLNNYFDIRNTPKATGLLRQVQLADTELLRIITDILKKNGLSYWLDYGTLLGAVRHGGFIPWDDDLDISMPREHYETAIKLLPEALSQLKPDCDIQFGESGGRAWIAVFKAGLILDIFPYDNVSATLYPDPEELRSRVLAAKIYCRKHQEESAASIAKKKEKMIGSYVKENPIWFQCPEWGLNYNVYPHDMIFPLRSLRFEDYDFSVPNDFSAYLSVWFGNYMEFPKSGVLHHKGTGGGVYKHAEQFHVDMDKLIQSLKSICVSDDRIKTDCKKESLSV